MKNFIIKQDKKVQILIFLNLLKSKYYKVFVNTFKIYVYIYDTYIEYMFDSHIKH